MRYTKFGWSDELQKEYADNFSQVYFFTDFKNIKVTLWSITGSENDVTEVVPIENGNIENIIKKYVTKLYGSQDKTVVIA